jgi:hypothetical protein
MDDTIRKEMRDLRLPVLWGFEPYAKSKRGAKSVFVCLHCKKGSFCHTKRPADFALTPAKLLKKHKECVEHFDPYSHYFEDTSEPSTVLPFVCKKYHEAELKSILAGEKPEETTNTLLEVKEPEKEYEVSLRILEFKEENTRLKAELAEEKAKKLLSEKTKALLTGVVEPDEDLSDEDLIEECVRAYQSLLKRATSTNRKLNTAMETKEVIQDIFENIMDADPELLVRSCTKEQVGVLRTYLKRD